MSFREKSAWIQFVSIFLVAGFFFLHVPWGMRMEFGEELFQGFLYCILALVVIEVAAHLAVALKAPLDARAPKDERERLIELKGIRIAYYVYVSGSMLALLTMHHGANMSAVGTFILLALVVALLVNYGSRIYFHRRGV